MSTAIARSKREVLTDLTCEGIGDLDSVRLIGVRRSAGRTDDVALHTLQRQHYELYWEPFTQEQVVVVYQYRD